MLLRTAGIGKKRGGLVLPSPPRVRLEAGDVRCLQAFGAGGNLELNRLAFVQRLVSLRLNRGEMDEDPVIFAIRDRVSLAIGVAIAILAIFATL